jgi:plastocyanin
MTVQRTLAALPLTFTLLASPFIGSTIVAQSEEPAIAVAGLTNPRGVTWNADGAMVIAEAGIGGEAEGTGEAQVPPPTGPYTGGPTARITTATNGCPTTLADGLPSALSASGEAIGAADVAYLGEQLYALVAGGGDAHGNPDQPSGVYTVAADGSTELLVDLGAWLRENPVAETPEDDFDPEGSWFAMVAAPDGSALWIVESNSEQVLSVTPEGEVTRVADLSADDQVPTALAAAPDGGIYVGHLTSAPFPEGGAYVVKIDPDGAVTTVWSGLTAITGLVVDADGTLYAGQLSTTRARPPFFEPGTGSIVRQTGEDSSEPVAIGLSFPAALDLGPDGALYVSTPAVGGNEVVGAVIRIAPGDEAVEIDAASLPHPTCGGDGTAGSGTTGATEGGSDATTSEIVVRIFDFGFDPAELTVPVGTTVIWANTGAVQHTTVARVEGEVVWDSNIMEPGDTFSFTFTEPGSWDYLCGLHPDMKATITVE